MILKLFSLFLITTMASSLECPSRCICSMADSLNLTVCQEKGYHSIPDAIDAHTNFLDLSANQLGRLPNFVFSTMNLTNLESIVMRRSGISELSRNTFANLRWLKELDLSENGIVSLDQFIFADNKILEMVNFSSNPLMILTSFQFAPLPRLKSLDLHSCALAKIEREAFSNLFVLETLNLKNNSLATLPSDLFTWLPNLKNIELNMNLWHCDCDIQMLTILLQYRGLYHNQTCVYEASTSSVPWHKMDNISSKCVPLMQEHMREMLLSGVPRLHAPIVFSHMNTSRRFSSHIIPQSDPHPWIIAILSASIAILCLICVIRMWARRRRSHSKSEYYDYEEEMAGMRSSVYRDYLDQGPSTSYHNENFCLLDEDGDSDMSVSVGL